MTINEAIVLLREAGVPSPEHDARALERHSAQTMANFDDLVRQRAQRVPLQHLLASAGFRYLALQVGPGVFVPRTQNGGLAGAVRAVTIGRAASVVVDLCAGA